MNISDCRNFNDFRKLAKKKLPAPIFHYIDGGADDEVTLRRNTSAFDDCDLIPNILASVGKPDLSTTIFGRKIDMPIFLSPTAMQRLYHPDGDKASARAAEKFGTFYSMSTMANNSIEEISNISSGPKLFQLYVHKDKSITDDLLDRCKRSGFDGMCLTVDTLVAGNREKDHRTGFTTPPKLTLNSLLSSERALNIKINEYEEYKDLNIYFRDLNLVKGPNYDSVKANFVVEDQNGKSFNLYPEKRRYSRRGQITTETAIYITPFRDIYLTIGDQLEDGSWIVNIQINFLIRWIWFSAFLMALAGVVLISSKRKV